MEYGKERRSVRRERGHSPAVSAAVSTELGSQILTSPIEIRIRCRLFHSRGCDRGAFGLKKHPRQTRSLPVTSAGVPWCHGRCFAFRSFPLACAACYAPFGRRSGSFACNSGCILVTHKNFRNLITWVQYVP